MNPESAIESEPVRTPDATATVAAPTPALGFGRVATGPAEARPSSPAAVLALQRAAGNSAVSGMLGGAPPPLPGLHRAAAPGGRCACGGVAGPDGECADCKAKRLAVERAIAARAPAAVRRVPALAEPERRDPASPDGARSRPVEAMAAMVDADQRANRQGAPADPTTNGHLEPTDAEASESTPQALVPPGPTGRDRADAGLNGAAGEPALDATVGAGAAVVEGVGGASATALEGVVDGTNGAVSAGAAAVDGAVGGARGAVSADATALDSVDDTAAPIGVAPDLGLAADFGGETAARAAVVDVDAGDGGPGGAGRTISDAAQQAGGIGAAGALPERASPVDAEGQSAARAGPEGAASEPAAAPPSGAGGAGAPAGGGASGSGGGSPGAAAAVASAAGPAGAPAEVAGVDGGSAAPPPAPAIDAGSGPALLSSLANAPASAFVAGVGAARAAAGGIQSNERDALKRSLPEMKAPTGLAPAAPRAGAGAAASAGTELPSRGGPELPTPAGRAGEPPEVTHPEPATPVPASRPAPITPEPAATESQEDGGWWGWLTGGISRFFGGLPTQDPAVSTDAGPRPNVDLTGDADPSHNAAAEAAAGASVTTGRGDADQATTASFGEQDVRPTVQQETLRPTVAPVGPPAVTASGAGPPSAAGPPALPPDMLARFDAAATPAVAAEAQNHATVYGEKQAEYERSTTATQEDGRRQIAEADAATRREQEGLRAEVRADVAGERERWKAENRQIEQRFGSQASARRTSVEQEIQTKVQTAHTDAAGKLASAEREAATAKQSAEAEAAAKKKEEEDRPKSWWERAKGAVSAVFDAIRSVVTAIFDKLRQAVRAIIEAAKSVVRGIIEAARQVVVGLIQAFGEFVKGLVTVALAAFPEAAQRARAWIDRRVDQATQAVNSAAEALKTAATRILDAVGSGLDAALGLLQRGLMAALDALEFLAKAPFEAMELLAKIAAWIEEHTHFIEGCQRLMDDPDSVIEAIRKALGEMIAAVPEKALQALDDLAGQLGPKAQKHERGIRKYLSKALDHLKGSWWEELKKMGWTLLWPWPSVWKDVKEIGVGIPKLLGAAFSLHVSDAIDEFLGIQQKLNSIVGAVYGWFFIGSVLIGAILGGIFGVGAGAVPGALAGAAFAGEVGEALVIALIATEGAIILKSAVDLARGTNTSEDDEKDYEKIGGSTLTIAITGAMMLLGELAADLAKAIWNGAKGLFSSGGEAAADAAAGAAHGPGGEAPKAGEAPKTAEPGELPEGKAGEPGESTAGPDAEVVNGEKVVASEPTADGHEVKVTEEGRCLICSTCEEVAEMYKAELEADQKLQTEFDSIVKEADAAKKAERLAEFEQKLAEARAEAEKGAEVELDPKDLKRAEKNARRTIDDAAAGKVRRAPNYHGRLPPGVEADVIATGNAYVSTGKGGRFIFEKNGNVVITEGAGSMRGQVVTSYGPGGPRGESGAAIFGGTPADPGPPVTPKMITDGTIPTPGGDPQAPAVKIDP